TLVSEMRADPKHALRNKLDQSLLDFARQLKQNDPDVLKLINQFKTGLMEDSKAQGMMREILSRLKVTFTGELANKGTVFMKVLGRNISRLNKEMQEDKRTQDKLDEWLKGTFARLINRYHHELGNMV